MSGRAFAFPFSHKGSGCAMSDEDGGITVLALFMFMVMLLAAGFAIDVNNAQQARVKLQGAADAAGHAALVWRYKNSEGASIDRGIDVARANMPTSVFGEVLATADVEFGDWDSLTRTFTPDPGNKSAVRVTARRAEANDNGLKTFLMGFIGVDELNMYAVSVWDAGDGFCPPRSPDAKRGEGFFALGIVDAQSNNTFRDGFCVHSETHVEFNQNNVFDSGVTVSMPNADDLVLPQSGFSRNSGLEEALVSMNKNLNSFFNQLPTTISNFGDPLWTGQPDYVTDTSQTYTGSFSNGQTVTMGDISPNAVNVLSCSGGTLTIDDVIADAVIITDCDVRFRNGAGLRNATLVSTSTGNDAVSTPANFQLGAPTYCSTGEGGATVLTMGDFSTAANFEAYGAVVVAQGNISVTANASGLAGVNFLAGGRIDMTSGGELGFCDEGPPDVLDIPVFRMVM